MKFGKGTIGSGVCVHTRKRYIHPWEKCCY